MARVLNFEPLKIINLTTPNIPEMSWNKKHDEFALECKLRPSSTMTLRWILRRAKPNEICEIEIDLRVFNNWVGKKRGSAYDRKTIREAVAQLDAQTEGMICIMKSYTPWYIN